MNVYKNVTQYRVLWLKLKFRDEYYKYINDHFDKLPNSFFKVVITPVIQNRLIIDGFPLDNKNILLGSIYESNNKIVSLVVNNITNDKKTSVEFNDYNKLFYSLYFILLEYAIDKNLVVIKQNTNIVDTTIELYKFTLIKYLKLSDLYDTKKIMLSDVITYFISVFGFGISQHKVVLEQLTIDKFRNYTKISDIFNALYDLEIVQYTPNNSKFMMSNGIGIFSYIIIHDSISKMLAAFIAYNNPLFNNLYLKLNEKLEYQIAESNILSNIEYDFNYLKEYYKSKNE